MWCYLKIASDASHSEELIDDEVKNPDDWIFTQSGYSAWFFILILGIDCEILY